MQDLTNLTTGAQAQIRRAHTYLPAALAEALCDALPDEVQVPVGNSGLYEINSQYVPQIAGLLQEIVAYTVSTLINAGSERDAVRENDILAQALEEELMGWSTGETE